MVLFWRSYVLQDNKRQRGKWDCTSPAIFSDEKPQRAMVQDHDFLRTPLFKVEARLPRGENPPATSGELQVNK